MRGADWKNDQGFQLGYLEIRLPLGCLVCLVCLRLMQCFKAFTRSLTSLTPKQKNWSWVLIIWLAKISCQTLNSLWLNTLDALNRISIRVFMLMHTVVLFSHCLRLEFSLPPRCPQGMWYYWGDRAIFCHIGPGGLAECDKPEKIPWKYSTTAGKSTRATGRTARYIHSLTDLSWPGPWRGQTVRYIISFYHIHWAIMTDGNSAYRKL